MAKAINMPKMGNTVESVIVGEIKISVGDQIKQNDVLFTYETDKSTAEYKAEANDEGKIIAILMEEGEEIPVLLPVIVTGDEGDDISEFNEKRYPEAKEEIASVKQEASNTTDQPAKVQPVSFGGVASQRAKLTADNLGIDLSKVGGTGIDGRIQESDVLAFAHDDNNKNGVENPNAANAKDTPMDIPVPENATRKPFSQIRSAIANTMMKSLNQAAQLTMAITIDASALINERTIIKKQFADGQSANSSINDIIVFALSRVLPKHPHLNALVGADYADEFNVAHISVAIDTPKGLFVPVVKDATNKSLSEITATTKEFIEKAQNGKLGPSDMQGGTFTISNLGLSGVSFFTPILNSPQAGLLGIGSPIKRLKFDDTGKVIEYPEITLSLTMDHRPNDGVAGTLFLKDIKETLENISSIIK